MRKILTVFLFLMGCFKAEAQLGKKIQAFNQKIGQADSLNNAKNYFTALKAYGELEKESRSPESKKRVQLGKATALNGMRKHQEALEACLLALKYSQNSSLEAYFQRSAAYEALERYADAQEDIRKMIELTEGSKNTAQRAKLFAKMADLQWKQRNHSEAESNLRKAISLDPANTDFLLQRANNRVWLRQYKEAFEDLDKALESGRDDLEIHELRTNTRFRMMHQKYHSRDAEYLKKKMTEEERQLLCNDMAKAKARGLKSPTIDLLALFLCD